MNLIDCVSPDIVVGTETWLRPDVHDSEVLPPGYVVKARRDRQDGYGGVVIITKTSIPCAVLHISKTSEIVAGSVKRGTHPPLNIAGLYRPPSSNQEKVERSCEELHGLIEANPNSPFWLTGDFNLPDISWSTNSIIGNQNTVGVNNAFLNLFVDTALQQMLEFQTRIYTTLDLFLTN